MAPRGRSAAKHEEPTKDETASEQVPEQDVPEETELPEQMEEPDGTPAEVGEAVPEEIVQEKKVDDPDNADAPKMSEFLPAQYDFKDEDYLPAQSL